MPQRSLKNEKVSLSALNETFLLADKFVGILIISSLILGWEKNGKIWLIGIYLEPK